MEMSMAREWEGMEKGIKDPPLLIQFLFKVFLELFHEGILTICPKFDQMSNPSEKGGLGIQLFCLMCSFFNKIKVF
jgi:hypothetical protein